MANDVYTFMIARLVGGVGVGISTIAAPLFIAEIAPAKDRGKLAGMFQFNIVFGIVVAFLSNYLIGTLITDGTSWRWMLGVMALPAFKQVSTDKVVPTSHPMSYNVAIILLIKMN